MELKNISYIYGKNQILDSVNLKFNEKCFSVLFGADDAGKTTLLHLIMGFIPHYRGDVVWESDTPPIIRFVPDDIIWEKRMTARQYMRFAEKACPCYDLSAQCHLCEAFSIPLDEQLLNLTYQENKMVQIIAALCANPGFLILDEPMNFLDSSTYLRVLEVLQEGNRKGMGILLATEKYADAKGKCSHYAYLKEGKVIASNQVPSLDYRKKVVTITEGRQDILAPVMEKVCNLGQGKIAFLYKGEIEGLPTILREAGGRDFTVEDMSLEEELEMDFSRWEEG